MTDERTECVTLHRANVHLHGLRVAHALDRWRDGIGTLAVLRDAALGLARATAEAEVAITADEGP